MVGAARALTLSALAAALVAAAHAAAQPFDASVGCRDGLPNGAYLLRDASGRLRVSGALARGRRTGTFVFWDASGARIAVVPYDDDRVVGTVALWHAPAVAGAQGRRKLEARFAAGRRDGTSRSWYDNGRPRGERVYERGTLADARAWTRDGSALAADDARAQAASDEASDDRVLEELAALVAANVPACTADTPRD